MRKTYIFSLLLVGALSAYAQSLQVGDKIPEFELLGIDGELVSVDKIDSKVIILDFWASWCGPCYKSVKSTLKPLYDSYSRADVEIIGISNDLHESKWRAAIDKWGLNWKNVWDEDKSLVRSYRVPAIPTYFIVDGDGIILASNVYSSQLKSEVRKALKSME